MVKLYLTEGNNGIKSDDTGKYINIHLASIIKADLISSVILATILVVGFSVSIMFLALLGNIL